MGSLDGWVLRVSVGGIYFIVNRENSKVYIGSAKNLVKRKCNHFHELRNKSHHNKHLQAAFNLYGEETFKFTIVEIVLDLTQLVEKEQHYLNMFSPNQTYNIVRTAYSHLGHKFPPITPETRAKMSISHSRPVKQLSLNGTEIATFINTIEAEKVTGIDDSAICKCRKGNRKTAGGFRWC